jgi:hypothetical protein
MKYASEKPSGLPSGTLEKDLNIQPTRHFEETTAIAKLPHTHPGK